MQSARASAGELAGAVRRVSVPRALREHAAAISLGGLVLVQWTAVLVFALSVRRNGWLYYQGGDQLWHYTTAWFLAHGDLPFTTVGYAWPFLLVPFAAVEGPRLLDGLPLIVLFNVLVLLPGALLAVYGLGRRLAGPAVGLVAAAFWVVAPWLAIPLFDGSYHEKYVDQFLPQALGLTAMSDLPSTVALAVAALLTARALGGGDAWAGAAAGLAAGAAVAIKPSVAIALPAFVLALVVARRWRALGAAGAVLVLPLVVLVVWKARGVGYLPAFGSGTGHSYALGGDLTTPVEKYLDWSLDHLRRLERDLRGEFFSVRLLELLALGGIIALFRRIRAGAVLVGGWFALIVVVKGGSSLASVDSGSLLRYVMPAFPAFCVLVAALLLLVPTMGGRLAASRADAPPSRRVSIVVVFALSSLFALALAVTALAKPVDEPVTVRWPDTGPLIPVVDDLHPRISAEGRRIDLRWDETAPTRANTFYRIFRGRPPALDCSDTGGALYCTLVMTPVGETREPKFSEEPPEAGPWVYRVSVAADYRDLPTEGDAMWISEPVNVTTE